MLDLARRRFPGADLREGDAVGLAGLPDAAYDLVVFSYNGLDAVDHGDRATALAAMARVVAARRPGAVLQPQPRRGQLRRAAAAGAPVVC